MTQTCTHQVVKTAMQAGPIYYGDKVHYFWNPGSSRRQYQCALEGVGEVVRTMLERLDAEFPPQSLEQCFCIFDVESAHWASQPGQDWATYESMVECRVHRLLREGMDESRREELTKTSRHFVSALVRLMPRRSLPLLSTACFLTVTLVVNLPEVHVRILGFSALASVTALRTGGQPAPLGHGSLSS